MCYLAELRLVETADSNSHALHEAKLGLDQVSGIGLKWERLKKNGGRNYPPKPQNKHIPAQYQIKLLISKMKLSTQNLI